jgi:uncharacterized protein (DUF362 family)
MNDPVLVDFTNYRESVSKALDALNARQMLEKQPRILLKPNLVDDYPPPITTPVECTEAVAEYIAARCPESEVVIAEGAGASDKETGAVFKALGYERLSKKRGIPLVDLNHCPLKKLENESRPVFKEIHLPEIAFTHYIVSIPTLKAHSLAIITGTIKNMMGFAPPSRYGGRFGTWKKAVFHNRIQQSLSDLASYLTPDLTVMDASVGMPEHHLGGRVCSPPLDKILAGFDPFETDRFACDLLGIEWKKVGHLQG